MEALASHGLVVVAPNQTGNTTLVGPLSGEGESLRASLPRHSSFPAPGS